MYVTTAGVREGELCGGVDVVPPIDIGETTTGTSTRIFSSSIAPTYIWEQIKQVFNISSNLIDFEHWIITFPAKT